MRKQFKNFLSLILISIAFYGCNSDTEIEPEFIQTLEKVKFENERKLIRILNPSDQSIFHNVRTTSTNFGTLDYDKIYKRVANEEQEHPNYMIRLYPPSEVKNSLEYLVLIGLDNGFRAYILQYQTEPEHINTITDPTAYTGYINILDLKRELLAQNYFIEGVDSPIPNVNGRTSETYTNCSCQYEYDLIVNKSDLSGTLVVTGITCTCDAPKEMDGSDAGGGGGIGDPLPDPGYEPINPDTGGGGGSGSGSGSTDPDGISKDEIGTIKVTSCDDGQIYTVNGCIEEKQFWQNKIDQETDPDRKRRFQLDYIATHNAQEGRDFKQHIESLLTTEGITMGEVSDINYIVNDYYEQLIGRLLMANFYPVVEAAHPFIELALIETGTGVLFTAVKNLLSVKWAVQLSKIGINTVSISSITSRMKSAISFSLNSITIKIGGRNLTGIANSSSKTYSFNNVTVNEAKAIFQEMTAGRQVKRVEIGGGMYRETVFWKDTNGVRNSITYRNYSSQNPGQITSPTIDISIKEIRDVTIELKFLL